MRAQLRPALIGLGWALIIGLLGATIMGGALIRLALFSVVALAAAILAFVARQAPRRITRIVVLLGALIGVGINYPDATAESRWYAEQRKQRSASDKALPTPPDLPDRTRDRKSDR